MDSNIHSSGRSPRRADGLEALTAAVDRVVTEDLSRLSDAALAERVVYLRQLLDRLEGIWLQELAAVNAQGAAGDTPMPSPSWYAVPWRAGDRPRPRGSGPG
jgi:hypothetical protein